MANEEKKAVKEPKETKTEVKAKAAEKKEETKKVETEKKAEKPVKETKKAKKDVVNVNTANKDIAKPTLADFHVIISPIITEKSMALIQNQNKATFKVSPNANKANVKCAFERLYKVKATNVSIVNVLPKKKTRGGRYPGKTNGYKKAIVTIAQGQAIDLFRE